MGDLIPRRFVPLVVASFVIELIILGFGYLDTEPGENGDARGYAVVIAVNLIIGYLVWRYVVPRETAGGGSARAALVLGVLAVLTGLMYWVGLAWILGPAAIALGTIVRERGGGEAGGGEAVATEPGGASVRSESRAQEATIGVALGWAGIAIATVIGILDAL